MESNKKYNDVNLGSSEKEIKSAFLEVCRDRFAMDDYQTKWFYEKHQTWKSYLIDTIHGLA